MITAIHPKLPMRSKEVTRLFYIEKLGYEELGDEDYEGYLMFKKDLIEIHFFLFKDLVPKENYGMVYIRVDAIDHLYRSYLNNNITIHPNGKLKMQPWGQKEFSILDPDNNLLTFGQHVD
ncbi:MAG: VOC family protein [Winogradskyella sp.]|uniref:bleomycin resistance protein n=1 Tax=Winogradskyella sp. TaxID=1883156 RepID=UPI00180F49E9|nr:VOC family protein [Winogradskyella sp.]